MAEDAGPEENPWQTLSSELKYSNPWIEVTEHQVVNPSGGPGIYGTVHFKHLAIGILPLDHEGYTWLVGQYRYPLERYSWEIPEGGGVHGVDPLDSAKRELQEETGIEAKNWQRLVEIDMSNSVSDERATVFLATGLTFGES
ncbi:MAG TPA: NUDIX hydrolase, partial [Dehalococcoidia bacterium]|nr:NUDIX hydrolase [Dehalococcoidia bacterium]